MNPTKKQRIRVGIVDSGFCQDVPWANRVLESAAIVTHEGDLFLDEAKPDVLGHGSAVLQVIAENAPNVDFVLAQVFRDRLTATPSQIAAAIEWLVEQKVDLITLSLGLRNDREILRLACQEALGKGVLILASTPAKGDPVYPAAYPGVFRMTGDARCQKNEISCLKTQYADFGGYVKAQNGVVGASAGCAYMAGHIARYLSEGGDPGYEQIDEWLTSTACYFGAEVRFPDQPGVKEGQNTE